MGNYEDTTKLVKEFEKNVKFDNENFDNELKQNLDELKDARKPNIAITGPANTGKSTIVNAIFGYEVAETKNVPGCTKKNFKKLQKYGVNIIDTPGYGSGDKDDRIEAKNAMKHSDLVIVVYNVMVGVTEPGIAPIKDAEKLNKPIIIVLNQTDLSNFSQRDEQRNFLIEHGYKNIVEVSALTGAGLDRLINMIYNNLPKNCRMDFIRSVISDRQEAKQREKEQIRKKRKEIEEKEKKNEKLSDSERRFLKNSSKLLEEIDSRTDNVVNSKDSIVNKYIFGAGASAALIGALPLPGSDIIPLNALQAALIVKIGMIYNRELKTRRILAMLPTLGVDELFRTLFRQLVKTIPVAGNIIGAAVAAAGTIAIGYSAKIIFKSDELVLDPETLKGIYKQILPNIKRVLRANKGKIEKLSKNKDGVELEKTFEDKLDLSEREDEI